MWKPHPLGQQSLGKKDVAFVQADALQKDSKKADQLTKLPYPKKKKQSSARGSPPHPVAVLAKPGLSERDPRDLETGLRSKGREGHPFSSHKGLQ
jgi:hypothetical protein